MIKLHKYQGAGNDFLIVDNRDAKILCMDGSLVCQDGFSVSVPSLCDRRYGIGADGVMLLEASDCADFRMVYFNSDGSGGMMCGNGGRCIVAFAADCGISSFCFEASDGMHSAEILRSEGKQKIVRLKMKDVSSIIHYSALSGTCVASDGYFLDTGTRHFVRFVNDLDRYPIVAQGRDIRFNAGELQPVGANVNYVEAVSGGIKVRTYEKGVEDETFACGTGIVASSIASFVDGIRPSSFVDGRVSYNVRAVRDDLCVDFMPSVSMDSFSDIWLTGPAAYVADIIMA